MIGRVRDFTEELFGEFGDELGKDFEDKNAGTGWDSYWDENWRCAQPLGKEVDNINSYLKTVCDKNSYTCESIKKIFENVRGIETTYTGKMTSSTSLLLDYASVIKSFTDTMKYGDPKEPLDTNKLREDTQELRDSLLEWRTEMDEKYAQEVEDAVNSLQTNGEYNWDTIEDWMQKNPIELTPAQIQALAQIYLDMEKPEDIEHFFACGYHVSNDGAPGTTNYAMTDTLKLLIQTVTDSVIPMAFSTTWAEPYPLYEYDEEKMNQYIERMQLMQILLEKNPIPYTQGAIYDHTPSGFDTTNPSEYPIRLETDANGRITGVRDTVITNLVPPTFALGPVIPLGGIGMGDPADAWKDRELIYVDWVTENGVSDGIINRGGAAARSYARGKMVEFMVDATIKNATEGAIKGATIVAGIVVGIFEDYQKYQKKLRVSEDYLTETGMYYGLLKLGGQINYTVVNGKIIVHGINLNTSETIARTNGFLHDNNYNLTPEQLHQLIMNGSLPESSGISPEKQAEIYQNYAIYVAPNKGYDEYIQDLIDTRDNPAVAEEIKKQFGDKYTDTQLTRDPNKMPPEVLEYLIDANERGL